MKDWLEKQFKLSAFQTDIKTELLAGMTTFVTMAYVLATVPNILGGAGLDKHVVLTAMVIAPSLCVGARPWKRRDRSVYDI